MGYIHHNRNIVFLHPGNIAVINDEILVAKRVASFCENYFFIASISYFFCGEFHGGSAQKLTFFHVDYFPVSAAAIRRSVCLQRKAGICNTSTKTAAGAASSWAWISEVVGTLYFLPVF